MAEPDPQAQAQALRAWYESTVAMGAAIQAYYTACGFNSDITPPNPEPEPTSPFAEEVAARQTDPRIIKCGTRADFDDYLAGGPKPNDRVVLTKKGTYGGPAVTFNSPGTPEKPWIICCDGDDGVCKPVLSFKLTVRGPDAHLWGLGFGPLSDRSSTGRLVLSGAVRPRVERSEFRGWLPDNLGAQAGSSGYAIGISSGGEGLQMRRCFVHDPGAWTQAEKDGQDSNRIFMRIEGGDKSKLHKNGLVELCWFGSTIQRPIPNNYGKGQADLGETGSNGPSYDDSTDINWTYRSNIYDGTGQGGPPIGFTMNFNGDVDTNPSGVVDTKAGGVHYKGNTFRNFQPRNGGSVGRAEIRFGRGSSFEQNWCDKATISFQGGDHVLISNVAKNGQFLILAGDIAWNTYKDGHQGAHNILVQDNEGELQIGRVFADDNQYPAQKTRVRGSHKGKIITQHDYNIGDFKLEGSMSTASGYREKETTFSGLRERDQLERPTGPLSLIHVGPFGYSDAP